VGPLGAGAVDADEVVLETDLGDGPAGHRSANLKPRPRACHDPSIVSTAPQTNRGPFDQAWLRTDLATLVDSFHLSADQDHFLRSRWLESVLWMEAAAQRTRTRYYALRLTTVVGAVVVPALVSINAVGGAETSITWLTFAVSLVVAVSAAVEGFFRF